MSRVLAVRLDSDGDVLLCGPAVRALACTAGAVDLLVSPAGEAAARLLPGVRDVIVHDAPWSGYRPPPVDARATDLLVETLRRKGYDRAVVFTSFHQSPLPMALLLRLAGVPHIAATCEDYPGSLLDVRHQRPPGHEVEAALDLARAAGGALVEGDRACLAVRTGLPPVQHLTPAGGFVVVHPTASVPARSLTPEHARQVVAALVDAGHRVVVTGSTADVAVTSVVAGDVAVDLGGRTSFAELAGVLAAAHCVVTVNTGPGHLAAAVGTPVVSLFAPVVPAERWAPWGVPTVLLGDQDAACAGSRARTCPVAGHPCLSGVDPASVVHAVRSLLGPAAPTPTVGTRSAGAS